MKYPRSINEVAGSLYISLSLSHSLASLSKRTDRTRGSIYCLPHWQYLYQSDSDQIELHERWTSCSSPAGESRELLCEDSGSNLDRPFFLLLETRQYHFYSFFRWGRCAVWLGKSTVHYCGSHISCVLHSANPQIWVDTCWATYSEHENAFSNKSWHFFEWVVVQIWPSFCYFEQHLT